MASAGSCAGLSSWDMWGQPPSALRGAKLRGVAVLDRSGSTRGSFAGDGKKPGCAWRTAEGGCPHIALIGISLFLQAGSKAAF